MQFQQPRRHLHPLICSTKEAKQRRVHHRVIAQTLALVYGWREGVEPLTLLRRPPRSTAPVAKVPQRVWDEGPLRIIGSADPFLSAQLLSLHRSAPSWPDGWYDPQLGLIVALPRQTVLIAHRLGTAPLNEALQALSARCWQIYHDTGMLNLPLGQAVSTDLYWSIDGQLHRLRVCRGAEGFELSSPRAFKERVIDRLEGAL